MLANKVDQICSNAQYDLSPRCPHQPWSPLLSWLTLFEALDYNSNRNVRKRTGSEVWSDSSFSARINIAPLASQNAPSEDSDQSANAQTDLNLRWVHSESTFSDVAAHRCRIAITLEDHYRCQNNLSDLMRLRQSIWLKAVLQSWLIGDDIQAPRNHHVI